MFSFLSFKINFFILYGASKLAFKLAIIDQIFKWWFINFLPQKPNFTLEITRFLSIEYVWNYGISFGIFQNYQHYSNIAFIIINSCLAIYLWYLIVKCQTQYSFIGYSFILGGALGNIIDRLYRGAVFDFIHFHYKNFSFPVFNLADSFITIGAMFILYDYYKLKKTIEGKDNSDYDAAMALEADEIRKQSDKIFDEEVK